MFSNTLFHLLVISFQQLETPPLLYKDSGNSDGAGKKGGVGSQITIRSCKVIYKLFYNCGFTEVFVL